MGLQKYGSPERIEPEASTQQKTAAKKDWDESDAERLREENERPETD